MKFDHLLLRICILVLASGSVYVGSAQVVCPTIEISSPDFVNAGEPLVFKAKISPSIYDTSKRYWIISTGEIKSGQGTNDITIDTTSLGGYDVTATLELGGVDRNCPSVRSSSSSVVATPPEAKNLHQYSAPWPKDEAMRIQRIAKFLNGKSQNDMIYLVNYTGKTTTLKAAEAERKRRLELLNSGGIAPQRIVSIDGGKAMKTTVVYWHVPTGAMPPSIGLPNSAATPVAKKIDSIPSSGANSGERTATALKRLKSELETGDPLGKVLVVLNLPRDFTIGNLPGGPEAAIKQVRHLVGRDLVAAGIGPDDYVIVENRKVVEPSLDYWFVPLGAKPPSITTGKAKGKK